MIAGIGPVTARKIVALFGDQVFKIIDDEPTKLTGVHGISISRSYEIQLAFQSRRALHDIMLFLRSIGLGASLSTKVYRSMGGDKGEDVARKIKANPYLLSQVDGIGFIKADSAARTMGIPNDSPERLKAGIDYVLNENLDLPRFRGQFVVFALRLSSYLLDLTPQGSLTPQASEASGLGSQLLRADALAHS